jgi:hypothetical protein
MDCHNAHGSPVSFTWWKDGAPVTIVTGGNPKTDPVNTGATYKPEAEDTGIYSANADFCWDCHYDNDQSNAVPNKLGDYGNYSQKVGMYRENASTSGRGVPGRWITGNDYFGSIDIASGRPFVSDHFKMTTASTLNTLVNDWTVDDVSPMGCSACHDPHGVSSNQGNKQVMVPALKGTWITSPYKEDRPPRSDYTQPDFSLVDATDNSIASGRPYDPDVSTPAPRGNPDWKKGSSDYAQYDGITDNFNIPAITGGGMGTTGGANGYNGYFIDENTFGYVGADSGSSTLTALDYAADPPVVPNRMTVAQLTGESPTITLANGPDLFAGLCLVCHTNISGTSVTSKDGNTVGGRSTTNTTTYPHETVFGTGWNNITVNIMSSVITGTGQTNVANPNNSNHAMGQKEDDWPNYLGDGGPWGAEGQDLVDAAQTPNYGHAYRWGAAQGSSPQSDYHQFPCSKCHTPHVSSLQRLMVTNCLDNFGTARTDIPKGQLEGNYITAGEGGAAFGYSENVGTKQNPILGTVPEDGSTSIGRNNACHSTNRGTGWNQVTPW